MICLLPVLFSFERPFHCLRLCLSVGISQLLSQALNVILTLSKIPFNIRCFNFCLRSTLGLWDGYSSFCLKFFRLFFLLRFESLALLGHLIFQFRDATLHLFLKLFLHIVYSLPTGSYFFSADLNWGHVWTWMGVEGGEHSVIHILLGSFSLFTFFNLHLQKFDSLFEEGFFLVVDGLFTLHFLF